MRAFVTGAGRGIGRAIALQLGREGYDVALHVNSSGEGGDVACKEIELMGRRTLLTPADFFLISVRRAARSARQSTLGTGWTP